MKSLPTIRNILMLAGLVLIVAGVARFSLAAGMIIAGIILVVGGKG